MNLCYIKNLIKIKNNKENNIIESTIQELDCNNTDNEKYIVI